MTRWLTLGVWLFMMSGCASQPEHWMRFHGEDEFYRWICQYEPMKPVQVFQGPAITYATQYNAECFRTLKANEVKP